MFPGRIGVPPVCEPSVRTPIRATTVRETVASKTVRSCPQPLPLGRGSRLNTLPQLRSTTPAHGETKAPAEPNFTGRTDADGRYTLDRSPWNHVFIWSNNAVVMFRVTPDIGPQLAGFIDISRFNLAHWRGNEQAAEYTVKLDEAPVPPEEESDEAKSGETEPQPLPN